MAFNVNWVYVVSFLDLFAVSLTIPILSAHLRDLGASHILIGFMSSVYAGSQLISGPVAGSWSDKKGRQKALLTSLGVCGICYCFLGIIESLWLILALRCVLGLFKHIQVLTRTIVADRVPTDEQSGVSGRLTALAGVGFMVGPAIGGNLAELEHGFLYVCLVTTFLFFVNFVIAYLYLPDLARIGSSDKAGTASGQPTINLRKELARALIHLTDVKWSLYWDIFVLKFLMAVSLAIFTANYFVRVQETFDITPKWAGYTISFQGFVGATAGFLAGWIDRTCYRDDTSFKRRNLHGFIIMAVSYVGLQTAPTLTIFMLWTIPLRASSALLRIVETDMLLARCPMSQRGSLVGTSNSISNIARLVAPLIAGIAGDLFGMNKTNLLSVAMSSIGVGLSIKLQHFQPIQTKID